MLTIKNLNKYFNKGKRNELHIINNTSLTLEDNGLIALLGPSGCGKTTLLNCIGGLDKVKSGTIYINNEKISSRFANKVDRIRNLNVGYIFQDYKLIDNMSVYDNIALVLTMIGIKDKKEIKTRVEYVLNKVGMLRYKRRPAGMLSGGERQRVGIARAIVKDPNIILADEPTGNLDSKNSLEIMKIIKAISKDRLVILVTHEHSLAKFYASRIIEIKDGEVINDYLNDQVDTLDYEIDNTFYLKDLNECSIKDENNDIRIFTDDESKQKIKLDIVVKRGNIYIRSNTTDKVEVIDDNSSIEMIDDHYKQIDKNDIDKYQFDFKEIINNNYKRRYSSIFNPVTLIINGFKKVFDLPILKKILLIGFILAGMFIMYSVSSIGAVLNIKDENFVKTNKEYLTVTSVINKVDDFLNYEKMNNIKYIIPGSSIVNFNVYYNFFYQTATTNDTLSGSLASINMLNEDDIIDGRMPTNDYEIVVDQLTIKNMFNQTNIAKMIGINDYSQMLNMIVNINKMKDFTIVGITDKGSPSIYANESLFINIIANSINNEEQPEYEIFDYNLYDGNGDLILKEGGMPTNDYEAIVNISNKEAMPINKPINIEVNSKKLTVVGYYYSFHNEQSILVNNNTIKYLTITRKEDLNIYSSDKDSSLNEFRQLGVNINDNYTKSRNDYINDKKESINGVLLVSGIILIISLVEIFLMIRSSFLSRIKEVGIYRAIGVKKLDIYKMFFGEIFAMTTLASVPGLLFMAYILNILASIKYLSQMFLINPLIVILSIIFVYLFNIIIGLLPIYNTIRKRPAYILARHDLD